jgi:predicted phosphodiesterase
MRLAAISDIHGNPIALEAVLTDVEAAGGVDVWLVLGDLCALHRRRDGRLPRQAGPDG